MLKAIFKPLLAYLLCVLIVVASVDRVPDPPVVKPHNDKAAKLCIGQHQLAPDQNPIIEQTLLHPVFLLPGFAWDIPRESTLQQPRPAVFRFHASDTSPPSQRPDLS